MDLLERDAPPLQVEAWLNTPDTITLDGLKGKVVVIEAFQMLCPGCVSHGLPLLSRIAETFPSGRVVTLGLHSVFEHHEVQGTRAALEVFVHEYRIAFPVGIDAPSPSGNIPLTMGAYGLRGTPSLIVIDQTGTQRLQAFGHVSDLGVGALIGQLLSQSDDSEAVCSDEGCAVK